MTVLTPKDGTQLCAMLSYALSLGTPVAIRYPRGACNFDTAKLAPYVGGNYRKERGRDVDIWAVGKMAAVAEDVRTVLFEKGIEAGIVEVGCVKPMDLSCLEENKTIVTIEDNLLAGGFGEGFRAESGADDVLSFGWPAQFIEHGSCDDLYGKYGLDTASIAERICEHLERKA